MAYVDGCEHDIFLSYAWVDDQTATEGERGWVSAFEKHLRIALEQRAGRIGAVSIWLDLRRIDGGQLFDRTVEDGLDASAVFVALTSTGYLASEYCRQELAHFHRQASGDRIGLATGDRMRILNVLLTNVDRGEWPDAYGRTSGFELHDAEREDQTGQPSEIGSDLFKRQLRTLADALFDLLGAMNQESRPASPPAQRVKGTVYLAEVADTLRSQRRNLTDDLKRQGIEIVSGVPPPYDPAGHDRRATRALEDADLSVHLFDAVAGREIEGLEGVTYPRRQVELAAEHGSRMTWLPRDLDLAAIDDEAHGAFLRRLELGEGGEGGADAYDFIRGVRADLARQVVEKVELLRAAAETASGDGDGASCLLVTHAKDTAHMLPVAGTLMGEGIEPYINQEANEPRSVLDLFENRLRQVASLIIFYGGVRREWVRERLDTAIKIAAMEQLDLKLAVFAAPPEKPPEDVSFSRGFVRVETLDSAGEALAFVGGGG